MRLRFCRVCRDFHNVEMEWPEACLGHFAKESAPATVHVISDHLDYVMNPADGKRYSSKSKYYKAVRAAGCEIMGSDTSAPPPRKDIGDPVHDIRRAMEMTRG
jgi:hypothetical protein